MRFFVKGHKKIGGRKAGTPNKHNTVLKDAFAEVLTPVRANSLVKKALDLAMKGRPGLLLGLLPFGMQELPRAVEISPAEGSAFVPENLMNALMELDEKTLTSMLMKSEPLG